MSWVEILGLLTTIIGAIAYVSKEVGILLRNDKSQTQEIASLNARIKHFERELESLNEKYEQRFAQHGERAGRIESLVVRWGARISMVENVALGEPAAEKFRDGMILPDLGG